MKRIILSVFLILVSAVGGDSQTPGPNYKVETLAVEPIDAREVAVVCVNGVTPIISMSADFPSLVLIKCVYKQKGVGN